VNVSVAFVNVNTSMRKKLFCHMWVYTCSNQGHIEILLHNNNVTVNSLRLIIDVTTNT